MYFWCRPLPHCPPHHISFFLEETKPHTGPAADEPSILMRRRTTVGKYLLNLRPQLWPYGKHRSSCTIITSKQTAEESILTEWHLSKRYSFITVRPDHPLPRGSVRFETKAAPSKRQLWMEIHHISLLSVPPIGHMKARTGSPCWDTVCC